MQKDLSQISRENLNISEEDLIEAQRIKAEKGGDFGEILVTKKIITERQLLETLSIQYHIAPDCFSIALNNGGKALSVKDNCPILKFQPVLKNSTIRYGYLYGYRW